tara:strand:+ start:305 stop:556 length:252 start_codon:yes stop_codon:yes gene_type:complete
MKITRKIEAGHVSSFWISYNGNWELTLADGSEIECKVSDEVMRDISKALTKKIAEIDEELLEAAKAKVVENLEAETADAEETS